MTKIIHTNSTDIQRINKKREGLHHVLCNQVGYKAGKIFFGVM